ncbi:uncharacterized protein [Anas platyrhynchos]|uniref:uncharacterized protein n=1 Tax=Anas platyrhynchos TaxID=8839 RepID=UPI003AF26805
MGNCSRLEIPRADLWWYGGGKILRSTLPSNWEGTCALVQLAIPFTLAFERETSQIPRRSKRGLGISFDDRVYIDSIGVPRGVPDEHKARNQIAAGFESLFWWVTINKNADWINYFYYNQQRFINYTKDAMRGIAEQLDAISKMAWENRIALDMMLAEEGGVFVCVILSNHCCTLIPNNSVPDGSVTRALQGLTTLASELEKKKVGIFATLIVVVGVLTAIGCCIILCVRGLVQWLTETALLKQMTMELPPYSDKEIMRRWKAKKAKKKKSIKLHLRERFCKNQQFIKKRKGGNCGNRNVVFAELHCLEGGNVVLRYAYSDEKV